MSQGKQPAQIWTAVRELEAAAWRDMVAAAPIATCKLLGLRCHKTDNATMLAASAVPRTPFNRCFALSSDWHSNDEEVAEALTWLRCHAAPGWVLQLDPDELGTAASVLSREGIVASGKGWAKFQWMGSGPGVEQAPPDLEIEAVRDDAMALDFADLVLAGFGFPSAAAPWFAELARRDGWSAYIAYVDGKPAGAGAVFCRLHQAWLGIDTTLTNFRRRGLQLALIERRLRDAGPKFAIAETALPQSSDLDGASYRNYSKFGFLNTYNSMNFASVPT
ncbi:hypothetical protein ACCT03_33575 [Rhizobium johnstonii]|uniref:hypothetical protein n=1 Tax=Rhizobium TaxID=379 RepID=UPI00102F68DD|nr:MULTISPECIES: hypothetical protein [Rhizobium]QND16930.1 hypothetical protein HB775_24525 [Rhizobium leguminosarum bv. trifolii]NEI11073.1 hypothetical protein [Rhizobium ruizarguesonis]TAV41145.1 hypothetical protein ELI29_35420 [Rhizobium leguminosarum]TBB83982.1 hypothetical protein ELH38_29500 [Rhizobium ruizarguesonis]TBF22344.1 hypothetical protein ELG92_35470 [Rhizobium leguminosarum]